MDDLIILLIKGIISLFGSGQQPPKPNNPPVPRPALQRRPPVQPPRWPGSAQRMPQRQAARPLSSKPLMKQAARAPMPAPTAPAPPVKAVPPTSMAAPSPRASVAVDAAALRRWLRPQTLRNQFILTEVLQPPLALRNSIEGIL